MLQDEVYLPPTSQDDSADREGNRDATWVGPNLLDEVEHDDSNVEVVDTWRERRPSNDRGGSMEGKSSFGRRCIGIYRAGAVGACGGEKKGGKDAPL